MSALSIQMRHEAGQQAAGTSAAGLLEYGAAQIEELEQALIDQSHQWIAAAHCPTNICGACAASAEKQRLKIVAIFKRIDSQADGGADGGT